MARGQAESCFLVPPLAEGRGGIEWAILDSRSDIDCGIGVCSCRSYQSFLHEWCRDGAGLKKPILSAVVSV